MNLKINAGGGDRFSDVALRAWTAATDNHVTAEFKFNGITCLVYKNTNLDWLWRDYTNAHRMDWKTIGPDCVQNYAPEIQAEIDKRNKAAAEQEEKHRKEAKEKDDAELKALNEKTAGIEIELKDPDRWKKGLAKNTDPYGSCCYQYAESWAKLMQFEIAKGKTVAECADKTSSELSFFGITGFMYGCVVSTLSNCWKHGEELRKWHNKEYGNEGQGVVNPAVLTLGKKINTK